MRKYTEIVSFPMFSPHFVFNDDGEGGREKVMKQYRTVRVLVELVCGNTLKKRIKTGKDS